MTRVRIAGIIGALVLALLCLPATASAAVTVQNFSYTMAPGTTLVVNAPGLLAGATDTDGGTLTASGGLGFANHGSATINSDGLFTFTADQGFVGADSFTFQACDSTTFTCATGTVSLTVTAPVPTAVSQSYTISPGATLSLPAQTLMKGSTVPTGDSLTAQEVGYNEQGTVTVQQDGGFDYSPPYDFAGNDSFTFELCDSITGLCSTAATVSIKVGTPPSSRIPATIRLSVGQPITRRYALGGAPTPAWSYSGSLPEGLRLLKRGTAGIVLVGAPLRKGKHVIHLKLSSTLFPTVTETLTIDVAGSRARSGVTPVKRHKRRPKSKVLEPPAVSYHAGLALVNGVDGNGVVLTINPPVGGCARMKPGVIKLVIGPAVGTATPCHRALSLEVPRGVTIVNTSQFDLTPGGLQLRVSPVSGSTYSVAYPLRVAFGATTLLDGTLHAQGTWRPPQTIWQGTDAFVNVCIDQGYQVLSKNLRLYCVVPGGETGNAYLTKP